jgi:predicted metalloenzyme YecM
MKEENDPCLLADEFRARLEAQVPRFLQTVTDALLIKYQIDVSTLHADHVCWRTDSLSEYRRLVDALLAAPNSRSRRSRSCRRHFELLIESEIGGRPIATFQLATPILSTQHQVQVIEIPSPKEGSPYSKGLEHVEFVISSGDRPCTTSPWNDETHQRVLENFRRKHPHVYWNTKAVTKDINPDLSVKFTVADFGNCSVKFHLMPLAEVIAAEKKVAAAEKE